MLVESEANRYQQDGFTFHAKILLTSRDISTTKLSIY